MEEKEQRRITIGEIKMADRKGRYSSPSIEPEGYSYLHTFGNGLLRENESAKLDYDDFDLYISNKDETYSYRFWRRDVDAKNGNETSRSYGEPVKGFADEENAVQHALSVYRGEQPEYISPELREWRRQAWWIATPILLKHQVQADPTKAAELYRLVTELRDEVHPVAKRQWEDLERTLRLALREGITETALPPAEWSGAATWARKLEKAWNALDNAHKELLPAIKVPPGQDPDRLAKVQTALDNYSEVVRRTLEARNKQNENR